jgi:hypothetical protein
MADGPWYSGSGPGDQNQALVTKSLQVALNAATKNGDALGSPVLRAIMAQDKGLGPMIAALGVNVGFVTLGAGKMAATAEGTAASATNYASTGATLTPARHAFTRQQSDYGAHLSNGVLKMTNVQRGQLVLDFTGVWANTYVDEIAALASSATNSSGATGSALTWSTLSRLSLDFRDRGAGGDVHVMLDKTGVRQLGEDAMSLGGAVQMSQQVQQFLTGGGNRARIGTFFGNLHVYMNGELDTDSGDTLGLAFTADGVHSKHEAVSYPPEAEVVANAGWWRAEARRPGGGVSIFEMESYLAVGIAQQAGIQKIIYA